MAEPLTDVQCDLNIDEIERCRNAIGNDDWMGYVLDHGDAAMWRGPRDEQGWRQGVVFSWIEEDEGVRPTEEVMAFLQAAPRDVRDLIAEVRRLRARDAVVRAFIDEAETEAAAGVAEYEPSRLLRYELADRLHAVDQEHGRG
jgi:hypothetical protein